MPAPPPRLSATLASHSDKLGLSEDQLYEMRKLVAEITKDKSVRENRAQSPYYKAGQWSRSSTPAPLAPRPPSAPKPHSSMPSQSRRLQLTHQNGRPKVSTQMKAIYSFYRSYSITTVQCAFLRVHLHTHTHTHTHTHPIA